MSKTVKSKYQIQFNSVNKRLLTFFSGKLPLSGSSVWFYFTAI